MTTTYEIMTDRLLTIDASDFLKNAYKIMREKGIRHLPVTGASGKVVGILSDRDLKLAMSKVVDFDDDIYYQFEAEEKVEDYMSRPVKSVAGTEPIENVAKRMLKEKVSAFLVLDRELQVCGIITTDDLLAYLVTVLEMDKSKDQITIYHLLNEAR